jgi:hypothetical protein
MAWKSPNPLMEGRKSDLWLAEKDRGAVFQGRATFVPARSDSLRFDLAIYRRKPYRSLLSEAFGARPLWASSYFPSAVGEDLDLRSSPPS